MGYSYGFVTRSSKYTDLEELLDAWAQFCRDIYFVEFKIAIDDYLYWFGNMQYPEAYEASLVFPDRDELKSNAQDGDAVVIYRAGSWSDLASEIEAEAKSRGIAPHCGPGINDEFDCFIPDGSTIFGCGYWETPEFYTVNGNTAHRLQYGFAADYRYLPSSVEDHREVYGDNPDIYNEQGHSDWASYLLFVAEMIAKHKVAYEICYDSVGYGDPSVAPKFPWPRLRFSGDGQQLVSPTLDT